MRLKLEHSKANYASYGLSLKYQSTALTLDHTSVNGHHVPMHFALQDQTSKDYGTSIAEMKKNTKGQWGFHKFYFEPEFKGGNTGVEDCVIQ